MAVPGIFTSDANIQGTNMGDFASEIARLWPTGTAPLLAISSGMKTVDAGSTIINWFEENHISGQATVDTGIGDTTTTTGLIVNDASFMTVGSILWNQNSDEYLFVTNIAGNTLTVMRGFAQTTPDTIDQSDLLQMIGNAHEEASNRPRAIANLGYPVFNYMQIFRDAWNASGTAKAMEFLTGSVVQKNKQDSMWFHAEAMEKSMLWGRKTYGTLNGNRYSTMDGLVTQIQTNVEVAAGGNFTKALMDQFLQDIFAFNLRGYPQERICFVGNTTLSVINSIVESNATMNIYAAQSEYGVNVRTWITPFGNLTLMTHPLMNENLIFSRNMYVFHPGGIEIHYLRRTMPDDYDQDGTRAGVDADYGVLTTECSIKYVGEKTGGVFTNIQTDATE